jgi:hypothetical protein
MGRDTNVYGKSTSSGPFSYYTDQIFDDIESGAGAISTGPGLYYTDPIRDCSTCKRSSIKSSNIKPSVETFASCSDDNADKVENFGIGSVFSGIGDAIGSFIGGIFSGIFGKWGKVVMICFVIIMIYAAYSTVF